MFIDRYANIGVDVIFTKNAKTELQKRCYSEKDGVRYISKVISKTVEILVLNEIENNQDHIKIDLDKNNLFKARVRSGEKSR
jgi:ATP-dependent Clp protease ATP-binding subunit ClpA